MTVRIEIAGEAAMIELGKRIGSKLTRGSVVFLQGDLGAGKTTLVKGLLAQYGYCGLVTSPTYTLVETYQCGTATIHHFDLYRMTDPEELETIGLRDLLDGESIAVFEWPERGQGVLPDCTVDIRIDFEQQGRVVWLPQEFSELVTA